MAELQERVQGYLQEKKESGDEMSQAAFARAIGIADSTFSRWYSGNYPADASKIERKVEDYLSKEKMRGEVKTAKDIKFVMTNMSKEIWEVLDYGQLQKKTVIIYGDAGCGKTYTATEWRKNKSNITFITATPVTSTTRAILQELSREFKLQIKGTNLELYNNIMDKILNTDTMIIIDEAQHLNHMAIETIRAFSDIGNIGVAFIGNAVVYDKMVGKRQAEFAQLYSRLLFQAKTLTEKFTKEDVTKVFGALKEDELNYMLSVCQSRYGLRGAMFLYMNASNNENTTKKGLMAMARRMGIHV